MAIIWTKLIPRWGGDTIEPPEDKKDTGYFAGDKPPAKWENWLRKGTYEALDETRDVIEGIDSQLAQDALNLNTHTNNSTNAHGVNTKVSKTGDTMTDQLNIVKSEPSGFTALRNENSSIASSVDKFIEHKFVGRDTVNSAKDCVLIRVTPTNVNWLGANLDFMVRNNDANPALKLRISPYGAITASGNVGSPEGVVTAPVGSIYLRSDGGASTTLYVKQSGTGNTGWVAK